MAVKERTITLTDRAPIRIVEDDWPVIASAKWWEGEYESQSERTALLRVRRSGDGRHIVYGATDWVGNSGRRAGVLLDAFGSSMLCATIREVAQAIGYPDLASECIANLPPERI